MKRYLRFIILLSILGIAIITMLCTFIVRNFKKSNVENNKVELSKEESQVVVLEEKEPEKKINIFSGNDRPISFMIDNNTNAQPQSALNKAYAVYEIIVEGNETRLMAIFKGVDADAVGPIRSARHYFLDYAMENDVIYTHLGMSPQAGVAIEEFNINNINGQVYDTGKARTSTSKFWRATHKKAPHNAYTNIASIKEIAESKGYRTTSDKESVLNYVTDEVNLNQEEAIVANNITIPYSSSHKVKYVYNEETKRYTRWSKGKKMSDEETGEDITTKNIIITFAENYTLNDGENKGRQDVITVGSLDGYYITNGKAIKIKCVKNSRSEQTVYQDLNGKEIEVNDGNTFFNICPIDADVVISAE